jgi:hypothetical protein
MGGRAFYGLSRGRVCEIGVPVSVLFWSHKMEDEKKERGRNEGFVFWGFFS